MTKNKTPINISVEKVGVLFFFFLFFFFLFADGLVLCVVGLELEPQSSQMFMTMVRHPMS